MSEEWNTRQSLLMRAKDPTDEEAWADFVKYYERFIYHLLHRMNLKADDFEDMVQYDSEEGYYDFWNHHMPMDWCMDDI